ncbi:MAG: hypothetical protein NTV73_05520 [Hyphomicrobiales bacterium]|nr:hypothetical protein [Hyphomicrobiales bacterium]
MPSLVLDTNALTDPQLSDLGQTTPFKFVITDVVSREIYKGASVDNVRNSLQILSRFPKRVIILKTMGECARMSGRGSGLVRRLIDERATAGFGEFCSVLFRDDSIARRMIEERNTWVERDRAVFRPFAEDFPNVATDLVSNLFSGSEVAILRRGKEPYPETLISKVLNLTIEVTQNVMGASAIRLPTSDGEMINTVLFRGTLSFVINALNWIRTGRRADQASVERVENDHVDNYVAAYGTFFDQVLTRDQKLLDLYSELQFLRFRLSAAVSSR